VRHRDELVTGFPVWWRIHYDQRFGIGFEAQVGSKTGILGSRTQAVIPVAKLIQPSI
jgi:hypothetical protein